MTVQGSRTDDWPVRCPHCGGPAHPEREAARLRALTCEAGHRFDAARQGHINLLVGRGSSATPDTAAMIMARERVQDAGLFAPVTRALGELAAAGPRPRRLLDCGAGTGHHLHALLEELPEASGLAIDLSPAGLKRAAKHPRTLALVWDLWRTLPVADASIDLLVDVFAPRHSAEYARVLAAGGRAVVVTPRPGHLGELAAHGLLGMRADKHRELCESMAPVLGAPSARRIVRHCAAVDAEQAADLVMMGPAGHHRDPAEVLHEVRAAGVDSVTLDVDVTVWQGHAGDSPSVMRQNGDPEHTDDEGAT